jgi:glucose uptake protein
MLSPYAIIAMGLAAVFFGSQFVPQKYAGGYHVAAYNVSMIAGIALVTLILVIFSFFMEVPGAGNDLEFNMFNMGLSLFSGMIWSCGNFFILVAISKIGISRTFPVVNLLVIFAFFSGILVLGELESVEISIFIVLFLAISFVILGSIFTQNATSSEEKQVKDVKGGIFAAALSALFFGLYNVPILASLQSNTWSPYLAVFFLSMGALAGSVILGLFEYQKGFIKYIMKAKRKWHLLAVSGGIIWGIGQICATIAMTDLGVAIGAPAIQGFVIVVGVIWGLAVFRELEDIPSEKRKKAKNILLIGCAFALLGSLIIGYVAGTIY